MHDHIHKVPHDQIIPDPSIKDNVIKTDTVYYGPSGEEHVVPGEDIPIPEDARGLGTMEGNQSHLFSDRMKDRGMSWTIKGAQHMGKAIQLSFNGELGMWCGRRPLDSDTSSQMGIALSFDLFDELAGAGNRAGLPATEGPHASRQWVKALRNLSTPYFPLN